MARNDPGRAQHPSPPPPRSRCLDPSHVAPLPLAYKHQAPSTTFRAKGREEEKRSLARLSPPRNEPLSGERVSLIPARRALPIAHPHHAFG